MDMAEGRRSRFMREAVLLYGQEAGACTPDVARELQQLPGVLQVVPLSF